jgi:hypothetical protein
LYQVILKSHPELDNIRKKYAFSLLADDKTGKAAEVWEELSYPLQYISETATWG